MNEKHIAAIALSNDAFPSFRAKLDDALRWLEIAAGMGCDLAVLPETLNHYQGDGITAAAKLSVRDVAMPEDQWQAQCKSLIGAASALNIAVTLPLLIQERDGSLRNCFFLISRTGQTLGCYTKSFVTASELQNGTLPAPGMAPNQPPQPLIPWEGLTVGGAICFDTQFPEVFSQQAGRGAQLFLCPSLWPGGSQLNYHAFEHSTPIVLAYPAWSRIIDITGQDIAAGGQRWETLRFGFGSPVVAARINFDRALFHADGNQQKMVTIQRDLGPRVAITFDQPNCTFAVESRCPELSIADIITRYELVERKTYLRNARRACLASRL
jgi:predicted amidohydrolase